MKNFILFLVLWVTPFAVAETLETRVTRDLTYAQDDGILRKLDFYDPADPRPEKPTPLLVWVHGGAWSGGSKQGVPLMALTHQGIAIASVDYRLSTVAPFPANVHDLKAAIRFLRANAEKFHIDPERIFIVGSSAGGHLAALTGLSGGDAALEGRVGDCLTTLSSVRGVISFFGASDLVHILDQSTDFGRKMRVPALTLLLGGPLEEKMDLARQASPVSHLDPRDPPLLLIHGDQDPQMPFQQSLDLQIACKEKNIPCQLIPIVGGVHGGDLFYTVKILDELVRWVRR
jgi:acetyl esterase/lipase